MTDFSRRSVLAGTAAIGAAALSGSGGHGPAKAAAPISGKQGPGVYRQKVGDFEITTLNDGFAEFPITSLRVPAEQVNAALKANYLPEGKLLAPFNMTLVNTGSKLVLIDTGNGTTRPTAGMLLANLQVAGVDPKSVDTVVISHFHGDHINGLLNAQNAPVFTNAEVIVPAKEWAFWMDDGNMSRAPEPQKAAFNNVRRVFGALGKPPAQYEAGKEVAPGITTVDTAGHTPGHTSFIVASASQKLFVQSDLTALVAALIVQNPEWSIGGDMDAAKAIEVRKKAYDMAAAERMPISAYHLPFPAVGYIEKSGTGYRFVPAPWSPTI
jgi:glyoxylase-like metal-dependent hydrolase (beta-lactamase superfamily II)